MKNVQTSPQNRRNFEKKFDAISGSVDKWPGGKLTRDSFVYSQVLSKVTSRSRRFWTHKLVHLPNFEKLQ